MARIFAVLAATLLAICAGSAFGQAAYVHDMTGTATATTASGQRALKIGDLLDSGTTVSTGDKSTAVVKFEDGQVMSLSERTSFRIVDYRYNKQNVSQSSAVFNLLQGGLRFITGVIGSTNRNSYRMTAGTATIGIRGTDGVVTYDTATQAVFAAVFAGAIDVLTAQGTQNVVVGLFTSVAPGQGPTTPQALALATPAVQQTMDNLRVRGGPINTPVVVRSSAAAAAAVANAAALAVQARAQPGNAALQAQAQTAATAAESLVGTAIQDAQQAFDSAVKAGAVPSAPAASPLPTGDTGTTSSSTTSGTPSGSSGSGSSGGSGGGGGGTASPN